MATRPTKSIEWGTGAIPSGPVYSLSQAQAGYSVSQQPTAQGDNDWQNGVYQWQQYFDANVALPVVNGGTTTLTAASNDKQLFASGTPGLTNTIKLPDQTTLAVGRCFYIMSSCYGPSPIQDSAGTPLVSLQGSNSSSAGGSVSCALFISTSSSTATGNWAYIPLVAPGQYPGNAGSLTVAGAGCVGEIISASVAQASGITLSGTTIGNITSVTLTAGDWEIGGAVGLSSTGFTLANAGIDPTSGSLATGTRIATYASNQMVVGFQNTSALQTLETLVIPPIPVSTNGGLTLYLNAGGTYTGTGKAWGHLKARRVR